MKKVDPKKFDEGLKEAKKLQRKIDAEAQSLEEQAINRLRKLPDFNFVIQLLDREIRSARDIFSVPIGADYREVGSALITERAVASRLIKIRKVLAED